RESRRGPEGRREGGGGGGRPRGAAAGKATLYIGIGRRRGVRPADIVGAIAGEARVPGESIGAIEITDQFTLVDVNEGDADRIIKALEGAQIRGRPVSVRRSREDRGEGGGGYGGGGYQGGGGGYQGGGRRYPRPRDDGGGRPRPRRV
ncbi:MAG TPA: DbpA RNA binding domain-containing protein, partial [Longimicrobium sp.]